MIISGLQKTTLLDCKGHVAATIFLGGCNFRCPFCHNMNIVDGIDIDEYSEDEIISFLIKRAGVLDAVCITGGEPTLYRDLPDFIRKIKEINRAESPYFVKLDTNGTNPEMLKELINEKLIDYVAMDIKSSLDNYQEVAGLNNNIENVINKVKASIEILKSGVIDYEFRTTIVKEYHDEAEIEKIGELIKGAKSYYLQSFTDSEFVTDHTLNPVERNELIKYVDILKRYVKSVELRGVD